MKKKRRKRKRTKTRTKRERATAMLARALVPTRECRSRAAR
jgi:hypothetical protein